MSSINDEKALDGDDTPTTSEAERQHDSLAKKNDTMAKRRKLLLLVFYLLCCMGVLVAALLGLLWHRERSSTNEGPTPSSSNNEIKASPFQPHIIYIILDDLGSHDLGMHGTGIYTPACDELARSGVHLSNYYVHPSCSPTRCAILSGRYASHTGIHYGIHPTSTMGLELDEETLPQVLAKVGYQRHAVGKWHVGHSSWEQTPTFRGFQSFYGFYLGGQDYFTHENFKSGYDLRYDRQEYCGSNCSTIVDERNQYSSHLFTQEAVRVIENHDATEPLFLWLAYQAVHSPNQVPQQYKALYKNNTGFSKQRQIYAGMLTAADEGIRNVTNALKESGLWDDTIIIVTTDNGGPTEVCGVQGSSNYPKRGGKCTVWQGGTTGDGILSGPALEQLGIATPQVFTELLHAVDWLPTLANMVHAAPEGKPLDGVNQLEALRGGNAAREELFVGLAYERNKKAWHGPAIRHKEWKLIEHSGGPDGGIVEQSNGGATPNNYMLFNLQEDPEENHNVANDHPNKLQELVAKMEIYKASIYKQQEDPTCPYPGPVRTEMGPTAMPWCSHSKRILFYS